ncbi:MAG: N-acetylmuramoyl-L-alanine amidase family protein [Chloroflexota bacterium]
MSDRHREYDDQRDNAAGDESGDAPQGETPASVIFMEMMRRAAANRQPDVAEPSAPPVESPQRREPPPRQPLTEEERRHAAAIEAQRVRRVQRRRQRRRQQRAGMAGGFILALIIVLISGGLIATILSWGTSPESLSTDLRAEMGRLDSGSAAGGLAPLGGNQALVPTVPPTPNYLINIGIVSGHMGPENDPGAVCPDGLTESEINLAVAQRVWQRLRERGYNVDLLEEFDSRLADYRANLLVSIHANDCRDYGEFVSGFLIAQAESRPTDGPDARLVECLAQSYGPATGLDRRFGLTRDMTDYHIFREIHTSTPGAIIELGFMKGDRELLTTQPDLMAQAIVEGIECFLDPSTPLEPVATATPAEPPTEAAPSV